MTWGRREELLDIEEQQRDAVERERQDIKDAQDETWDKEGGRIIGGRWYSDAELPGRDEL